MKTFYIIDGHALCYRAYYAFIRNPLYNSKGQNTSAIYGFARMFFKLIEDQNPDYLAVAFDPPRKTFRSEIFPEYKANRKKTPDDLKEQVEEIKNLVRSLNIPVIIPENTEADDVLGTLSQKYSNEGYSVILVTGDKDAYQLVNDNVKIYANTKGITEHVIYDSKQVYEKLGVTPEQIIDYMALVGDTADNIPGVKGIGAKTAEKLINQYGNLDGVYQHIDEIKGANNKKLIENKENAYLSRELVTIKTDVDVNFNIDDAFFEGFDHESAVKYFTEMEMKSIIDDYFSINDYVENEGNEETLIEKNYTLVETRNQLNQIVSEISNYNLISIDTETTSLRPVDADIVGFSISVKEGQGWYFPIENNSLFNQSGVEYSKDEVFSLLKPIIENENIKKVGQNIKYDYIIFKNENISLNGIYFDTMVASYLLDPSVRRHNMDDMAQYYLNYKTIKYSDIVGKGKNAILITDVPIKELADYACEDTDITLRLYNKLKPLLKENNLFDLFTDIEMPLVTVLAEIEYTGVKIDTAYFTELSAENNRRLKEVEDNIHRLAGSNFNINSTKELSSVLFDQLNLKPVKKTKTGFSTDISVLEALKNDHEIIPYLIDYRTLSKLKSTYIEALPKLISQRTGRIHTSYNQAVVATGRLSSTDPNLQNIPSKDEFGKKIRHGFVAEDGYEILAADYSQIELRLAAHISGDDNMIKAFNEGIDIHSMTASSTFGVDVEDVDPWMRRQAKIINFSTIYGVSPYGLSQQADISMSDAKDFIDKYFETYPKFQEYIDETIDFAKKYGYVQTLLGRKRHVPEINAKVKFRREGAERVAINTPIQGTSADMIKIAMNNIFKELQNSNFKSKIIMQVHDELVLEVHKEEKLKVSEIVEREMVNALELKIPVKVDCGWGLNWEDAH